MIFFFLTLFQASLWIELEGYVYQSFSTDNKTYIEADKACQLEGGHLSPVHSGYVKDFLVKLLVRYIIINIYYFSSLYYKLSKTNIFKSH